MPIALKPGRRLPIWLDSDADDPESSRPTFVFRYITSDEFIELGEVYDRMKGRDVRGALGELYTTLEGLLIDRNNLPAGPLSSLTTPFEANELVGKLLNANRLGATESKNSDSPSPSSGDRSAAASNAIPDTATTAPAN